MGGKVLGGLVALLLIVVFSALDYLARPHLPDYFGDNDIYALVIILAIEFMVIWRMAAHVSSRRYRGGPSR